jgi:hypothetical protein
MYLRPPPTRVVRDLTSAPRRQRAGFAATIDVPYLGLQTYTLAAPGICVHPKVGAGCLLNEKAKTPETAAHTRSVDYHELGARFAKVREREALLNFRKSSETVSQNLAQEVDPGLLVNVTAGQKRVVISHDGFDLVRVLQHFCVQPGVIAVHESDE